MKRSRSRLFAAAVATMVIATFAMAPLVDAAGDRGGGSARAGAKGGGGGARASGSAAGGARASTATAGGATRQSAQVNNTRADARTNDVRSTSVNNVNVNRNVNVNVSGNGCCNNGWDNDYHPVATAAAVGATVAVTSAIVGSMVSAPPPGCVPVNYGGLVYQQCGSTWYAPQGTQFVVVNPPY